jgi:DNA-binding Xre family transcriptional regulator
MIRFYLQEMIAEKKFKTGTKITLDMIARETGVSRITLSRINSQRGYNTTTDNIGKLCRYFDCQVDKLMAYVPDEDVENQ